MFPTRYTNLVNDIRKKHGSWADRAAAYLRHADPLADNFRALYPPREQTERDRITRRSLDQMFRQALEHGIGTVRKAPPALQELFGQLEHVPVWLNPELLNLGARTYLRCGAVTGLVLGCCCLPLAYRSAAGNKPLAFTGNLIHRAGRRLTQTGQFFLESCKPGCLNPHASGWQQTVRVRMQHAQMRRLLLDSTRGDWQWREEEWGEPINQLDLAGTCLLFSANLLHHLRGLGFHFSTAETEAVMHLWRYSGYLLGIEPELLCATQTEGARLVDLILDLTGPPDKHSLALTDALMSKAMPVLMESAFPWLASDQAGGPPRRWSARLGRRLAKLLGMTDPEGRSRFCYGLSHGLLGPQAEGLNYPATAWRYTAPVLLRSVIIPLEVSRRLIPGGTGLALRLGARQIQQVMQPRQRPPDGR